MTDAEVLSVLQADLGELRPSEQRAAYLLHCVDAARALMAREGIDLTNSIEDGHLLVMYAAYLVRKRATAEPMPRMLRWALNNRLFAQKAGEGNAT